MKKIIDKRDTQEFVGQIIDVFEDFLAAHNMEVPNPEKEEDEELEDAAIIFGSHYDEIEDKIREMLNNWNVI